jgi:putative endonuclease
MFYVYVLKSQADNKLYFGSTNDLKKRFTEHNAGKVRSTKGRTPLELVYYEAYRSETDARERESRLKNSGNAMGQLKRRIKRSIG